MEMNLIQKYIYKNIFKPNVCTTYTDAFINAINNKIQGWDYIYHKFKVA